jgi:hypothetical protein
VKRLLNEFGKQTLSRDKTQSKWLRKWQNRRLRGA